VSSNSSSSSTTDQAVWILHGGFFMFYI
jgi:hypothetical protein